MELIKIYRNDNGTTTVSARELHNVLEVKTDFTNWCKRMFDYGFEEDKDFTPFLAGSTGGRPSVDYALTLDTAKEISMLQRTDKGKKAREYFIAVEKQATKPMTTAEILLQQAQFNVEQERRINTMEQKMELLEAKSITRPEYFTVAGYASLIEQKIGMKKAAEFGRKASKICKDQGYDIDSVHDARYGKVGSYPKEVLMMVFNSSYNGK